jgi:dihydroorotate dehydrogenase
LDANNLYLRVIQPLLFRLAPDDAHRAAQAALRWPKPWNLMGPGPSADPRLSVEIGGVAIPNPIGLAPGFDKDCELLGSLQHLGFGFLAPGAIMGERRAGNPRPRLGRIVEQQAVYHCMGLPSKGLEHAVAKLRRFSDRRVPVFAEVAGVSPEQIIANFAAVQPHAELVEVSLHCPNTHDTDKNKAFDAVMWLLREIGRVKTRPAITSVPHDFHGALHHRLPEFLDACVEHGIDGVIAAASRRFETTTMSIGFGQLSGKPVFADTRALVAEIAGHTQGRLAIIAAGGVLSGDDAFEMLQAGASAIQVYSAFVFRGPFAPALINQELLAALNARGIGSVRELQATGWQPAVEQRPATQAPAPVPA